MQYRQLGSTGLQVSAIGLGGNKVGRRSEATLRAAVDLGITLIDTANSYTCGQSEDVLRDVLRGRRDRVVLCSKAGHAFCAALPAQRLIGTVRRHSRWNYSPRFLEMALTGSLRRLGTDYLDVFYLHNPPSGVLQDDGVFDALDRFKTRGWIRHYGVSCARRATSTEALAAVEARGVSVVQIPTNVCEMIDPALLAPQARARGVGLIGRQPFARGAAFSDQRLLPVLAAHPGRTPAQAALRFALGLDGLSSVLVGMRTMDHILENLGALDSHGRVISSPGEAQPIRASDGTL